MDTNGAIAFSTPIPSDAASTESAERPPIDQGWPTLEEIRLRYIGRTLERTRGNKTRAADMLGIDRRTLNRILARERRKRGG